MDSQVRGLVSLLLFSLVASAQPPNPGLPTGTVGVPYTLDLGEGLQNIPIPPDISFTYSFTVAGGSLPPGITLAANGLLSGTPTAPGSFTFNVRFAFTISSMGESFSFDQTFPFSITIQGNAGPQLTVEPRGLVFSFFSGASASSLNLSIANKGNLARVFNAT